MSNFFTSVFSSQSCEADVQIREMMDVEEELFVDLSVWNRSVVESPALEVLENVWMWLLRVNVAVNWVN